jgi:hypothetical protein
MKLLTPPTEMILAPLECLLWHVSTSLKTPPGHLLVQPLLQNFNVNPSF